MRPDKAANAVEAMFSQTFASLPVSWDEIRDNIRKSGRGSVGSGYGYTLFHAFVQQGNELAVNFLIEKGADVNATTREGITALHVAIKCCNESLARLLMESGADIAIADALGRTSLILAVKSGSIGIGIVRLLLEMKADIEARDKTGETALMAAAKNGLEEIVRELLDNGADGENHYPQGHTPREVAAQRGHMAVAQLLQAARNRKRPWFRRILRNENDEYKPQKEVKKEEREAVRNENLQHFEKGVFGSPDFYF